MDEVGDVSLIAAQYPTGVVFGEIGLEMTDSLLRAIIEHIGVVVIGNAVEINETAYDVILQAWLVYSAAA
jgi:hypothetical protein